VRNVRYSGRVLELVESYRIEVLFAAFDEIISYGEKRMRKKLKAIPEGNMLIVETSGGLRSLLRRWDLRNGLRNRCRKPWKTMRYLQKVAASKP
jgi:hypothetical protein